MIRKIIKALWIFLAVIVLAIVVIFVSISKGWIGYMPPSILSVSFLYDFSPNPSIF
mgnify:CR=1 FL=1